MFCKLWPCINEHGQGKGCALAVVGTSNEFGSLFIAAKFMHWPSKSRVVSPTLKNKPPFSMGNAYLCWNTSENVGLPWNTSKIQCNANTGWRKSSRQTQQLSFYKYKYIMSRNLSVFITLSSTHLSICLSINVPLHCLLRKYLFLCTFHHGDFSSFL